MQFNSYIFICFFLPVMVIGYFLGNKIRVIAGKLILIAGSILFYAYFDWTALLVVGISLGINFFFAAGVKKWQKWNKLFLVVPVIINISLLLYFKYTNFVITNFNTWLDKDIVLKQLVLPLGISFFTFQQIAYMVATYKNEIERLNIIDYLIYILYFPKILMGPLADPVEFIAFGLFKKLLLADTFSRAVAWGYTNIEKATAIDWILIMLFYTFEIYFDFSGYSDMAVGSSIMLNITLPINFDSPYKAISIRDFWKRWHMSLTKFFTKWHGANWTFILWGLLHGILSVLDRVLKRFKIEIFEPFSWLITFGIVNVLWLLFRSDSIFQWKQILQTIVLMANTTISDGLIKVFTIPEAAFFCNMLPFIKTWSQLIRGFWMTGFIGFSLIVCFLPENNYRSLRRNSVGTMVFTAMAFIWSFICLGGESVFVYFNF